MKNPLTDNYLSLKSLVLSSNFPWYFCRNADDDFDFHGHSFIERPESGLRLPVIKSNDFDLCYTVFMEILEYNEVSVNTFYRMGANAVSPSSGRNPVEHVDHEFPHKNLLVYLTDAGGATIVEGKRYDPQEDSVLLFTGRHYHEFPKERRRVVLVATFI